MVVLYWHCGYSTWVHTFLSQYLHPISSVLNGKLHKYPHQCGVRIGLYTLSSRWGLHMGCCIVKGVSEQCIARLLLTSLEQIEQKILLLEHVNSFTTNKILTKVMTGI